MKRGKIKNRKRKQQIIDFSKLRIGKCTPTDIDGAIEIGMKSFYIELKYQKKGDTETIELTTGQRLFLENQIDKLSFASHAVAVVAVHHCPCKQDIKAHKCRVDRYYFKGEWHPGGGKRLDELLFSFFTDDFGKTKLEKIRDLIDA